MKRSFKVGDLVLREVKANTKNPIDGKLGPTWKGLYEVIKVFKKGAYELKCGADPERENISELRPKSGLKVNVSNLPNDYKQLCHLLLLN